MMLVIRLQLTLVAYFLSLFVLSHAEAAEHPNVLWIVVDDMSPNFSCYGETVIQTPHVDRLAAEGVRFTRAYATSQQQGRTIIEVVEASIVFLCLRK